MVSSSLVFATLFSAVVALGAKEKVGHEPPTTIPANISEDLGIDHPLAGVKIMRKIIEGQTQASISVHPLVLQENGQEFEFKWKGIQNPKKQDWIALYMDDADPFQKAPVRYFEAGASPTHADYGYGSLKVPLFSHRGNMRVVFLRQEESKLKSLLAVCPDLIEVENPYEPLRIHLALTGNTRELLVQWVSAPLSNPIVKWGLASSEPNRFAPAEYTTYTSADLCGGPATKEGFFDPGRFYSAVLTDLVPGEFYKYQVGDEDLGLSKPIIFKAPGLASKLKLAAVGDMGQSFREMANAGHDTPAFGTSKFINAESDIDLVFHIGDISYAMGFVADWDLFMDQWGEITTKVPYMVSIGNHERDWPYTGDRYDTSYNSGGECGVPYERRFKMPQAGADKPWYSFEMGPVHFTVMSVEHDFRPGSEQHRFLKGDFASVNRSSTPWLVLAGHRPMYLSVTKDFTPTGYYSVSVELQVILEDLLLRYKVDMLWAGHHHSYHRSCPVYKGRCVQLSRNNSALAPVHFVFGTAGAGLYHNLVHTSYGKVALATHGYLRAEATTDSFIMEFVSSADGSILDSYKLHKSLQWEKEWSDYWASAGSEL